MKNIKHQYLIAVQYLGFRSSGWQKQPGQKTVEGMLLKTLKFIISAGSVKILGAGRTDAKVSAQGGVFELFTEIAITDIPEFLRQFNTNLPPDIRVQNCQKINGEFNIIQDVQEKEYHYFFSFGTKNHPFCAPFMANITEDLNVERMIKAATLFTGTHCFRSYTTKDKQNSNCRRTINKCCIETNTILKANFFPEKSYVLRVRGKGFMRYQIRMIMGALILLGKGELQPEEIIGSLKDNSELSVHYVAPGSGLVLQETTFKDLASNF